MMIFMTEDIVIRHNLSLINGLGCDQILMIKNIILNNAIDSKSSDVLQ